MISNSLFTLCLLFILRNASAQRFLREGFSSKMESDFKAETKLDGATGLTREMSLMKDIDWELQPATFENIPDARLRRHLESFLQTPLTLKLSTRKGKYGLRAVGHLASGKRLRAFWRQSAGPSKLNGDGFLSATYDDAIRSRLSVMEFEVQLPPHDKKSKELPSVIFSVPVEPGSMNPKAIVPRGAVNVRVLPKGRISDDSRPQDVELGKGHVHLPMRAGLVDAAWAKGRSVFRKGRINGVI
mmetsp:Transcript_44109/g.106308  ORF Transcript_44109/g.106308 Transcript_44109/m.106308 type:complete len:243 (+) Transcript_44109:115-843(+)